MAKWLTSFVLIVTLAGSALAGFPLQAGAGNSEMASCCKAALAHDDSPATLRAKLCCAINCSEPGPTAPTGVGKISPHIFTVLHPAIIQSQKQSTQAHCQFRLAPGHLSDSSPPPYIRHAALLI